MIPLFKQKTFLDLFPAPEFLLLSTTGIVITDTDTKLVQLRREIFGDGFELSHASQISNPDGAVESGVIKNPNELRTVLKKLSELYNIRYAHATLPEEKAYLFTTTINRVPPEGLRDAVAFIVEENVPISLAESVFDFEVVGGTVATPEIKVAVSVLPREIVNNYVELFESAGIVPISFDIESQAIARAVIHRGDKRPHLIINLSQKKTGFYVVEEEVVQFSTTPAYSVGESDSSQNIDDLKVEMRKVLTFWNTRTGKSGNPERKIEKAILCGPGASKKDFVEKLMKDEDVPYALANVWINTSPARNHVPGVPFEESLGYASAIGLVLSRSK